MNEDIYQEVYQVRIQLKDTKIWRRFLVLSDTTLPKFHKILQTIMGWSNYHLHHFIINDLFFSEPNPEDELRSIDYRKIRLENVMNQFTKSFIYEYDFGDGWIHELLLENVFPVKANQYYPVCTGGEKRCPPEDCGGIDGYEEILEVLKDRKKPENRDILEWLPPGYDPEYFSLNEINYLLQRKNYGCPT